MSNVWSLKHQRSTADFVQAGRHTLGVRTSKCATYAASLSKLGQHLDGRGEFNWPLSCGSCLEGSVKEKWHHGTVQCASTSSPAISVRCLRLAPLFAQYTAGHSGLTEDHRVAHRPKSWSGWVFLPGCQSNCPGRQQSQSDSDASH